MPLFSYAFFTQHKAHTAYNSGDYATAQKLYEQEILADHTNMQALYNLADSLYKQGKFEETASYFQKVSASNDAPLLLREHAQFNLGNTYVKLKKFKEAKKEFEELLQKKPSDERVKKNFELVKLLEIQEKMAKKEGGSSDSDKQDKQQDASQKEDQGKHGLDQKDSQDNGKEGGKEGDRQQAQDDFERDAQSSPDKQSDAQEEKNDQKGGQEHTQTSPNKKAPTTQDKKPGQQKQGMSEAGREKDGQLDKSKKGKSETAKEKKEREMEAYLEALERESQNASKRIMKYQLKKGMKRKHGQKNW